MEVIRLHESLRCGKKWFPRTPDAKFLAGLISLVIVATLVGVISVAINEYMFDRLSPAEHLRIAKGNLNIYGLASRHLEHIPSSAPEYREVPALLASIRADEQAHQQRLQKELSDPRNIQAKRDEEARTNSYWSSYWSTTLRVNTDMDSFWLNGEERTCQTYPDAEGRIGAVACNNTGSHRDRNIPVKFWGGVDRNTVSDWKCRREGDEFVCRAID